MRKLLVLTIMPLLLISTIIYPINAGPIYSQNINEKKITVVWGENEKLVIMLKKSGWLQWYYKDGEIMNFDIYQSTQEMNEKAIVAKIAAGWIFHLGIGPGDARHPYVGGEPFIYKSHNVPNKSNNEPEVDESLSESQQNEEKNLENNNNSNNRIENNLLEEEDNSEPEKNTDNAGNDNNNFDRGKGKNKGKALGKNKK